ncbi:MAG: MGMT family protein [Pseudomonadota bacterium]
MLDEPRGRNERVWDVVSCIPAGRVATYKQIAALAGIEGPSGPRQVGYALAALPSSSQVPWHRVINIRGQISRRSAAGGEGRQADRLILEGVQIGMQGKIDLAAYGWDSE